MKDVSDGRTLRIDVLLSQYTALRNEIEARSTVQGSIINLSITAIGALGGVGLSRDGDARLLFLIPPVLTMLGLHWIDHAANINNIGDFIKNHLLPRIALESNIINMPDYEAFVRQYERRPQVIIGIFMLPLSLIYVLTPVMAVLMVYTLSSWNWILTIAACVDIFIISIFIFYWVSFLMGRRKNLMAEVVSNEPSD
jgi:hypothetical protein